MISTTASAEWDYPMGHISMIGKQDMEMLRAGAPAFAPGKALDAIAKHSLDFWMTSEDLPDPNNRVLVGKDGTITLAYTENNLEAHRRLAAKLKSMLNHIGCEDHLLPTHLYLGKKIPIAGHGASMRDGPLRARPEDFRARRELQNARSEQSLRRRCEFFCLQQRGESLADDHRQRPASGRPSLGQDGLQ